MPQPIHTYIAPGYPTCILTSAGPDAQERDLTLRILLWYYHLR